MTGRSVSLMERLLHRQHRQVTPVAPETPDGRLGLWGDLSLLWRTMLVLWRELNSEKGAKMMATLLRVNGDVIVVEPANGKVFTTS